MMWGSLRQGRRCAAVTGLLVALGTCTAVAYDGKPVEGSDPGPITVFKEGVKRLKKGDTVGAEQALSLAASQGHTPALWKLARMYAGGEGGLPRDELKAFEYYQKIVDAHGDDSPDTTQARFVSNAIVALGSYYLTGIPNTRVRVDEDRAADLFRYAATYFGDSDAQYNLGRLYLDGSGARQRNPVMAARWLRLAADKGQRQAQAVLGHLLFAGDDVPRQAARGLMYLKLARDGTVNDSDKWIVGLYEDAFSKANSDEIAMGQLYLKQFMKQGFVPEE